jgi:hypothetical protein
MMKLIREYTDYQDLEMITEKTDDGKKKFKIKGPFLVAEMKNKNKRVYSKSLIEREINRFTEEKIKNGNPFGCLDHDQTPTVIGKNVAIAIDELKMENNIAYGTATVLDTPNGRIVKAVMNDGYKFGVSSRGVGSMNGQNVNEDYIFITEDVVTDPSAPGAFVDGILENKEYIMEGNKIVEVAINNLENKLNKQGSKALLSGMLEFLEEIRNNINS